MRQIDKLTDKLARNYRKVAVDKIPFLEAKKGIGKELNEKRCQAQQKMVN